MIQIIVLLYKISKESAIGLDEFTKKLYYSDNQGTGICIKILQIYRHGGENMKTFNLMLNSINDVKDFVNIVSKYDFDVDLTSGRYVVDAKSIMGIFSLNLSKPIKVEVHSDNCDEFIAELERFIVD